MGLAAKTPLNVHLNAQISVHVFLKVFFTYKSLRVIHKGCPHKGVGGLANADACVNFACKRPNFADVGGGG